jgi:hypothetical protein
MALISSIFLFFAVLGNFEGKEELENLLSEISDIYEPNEEDFKKIQNYMETGQRPYLKDLDAAFPSPRRTTRGIKYYNGDQSIKVLKLNKNKNTLVRKVIISYATLNGPYARFLEESFNAYQSFERDYDIYFMIGGFPSSKKNGVGLFYVPYSWKATFFQKMYEEGYDQVLWVDSACFPMKNPSHLFHDIASREVLLYNAHKNLKKAYSLNLYGKIQINCYKKAFEHAGTSFDQLHLIPHIQATVLGLDFRTQTAVEFLNRWLDRSTDVYSSISYLPEELILSCVAYEMGYTQYLAIPHPYHDKQPRTFKHRMER